MSEGFRAVGRVRKAFGLKGELLVHPLTNEPDAVFASGRVVFMDDAPCTIQRSRPFKDGWLVKLEGVDDKTAADALRARWLSAPTSQLSPPTDDEVYLDELAGMVVRDQPHGVIGTVRSWYELPQGLVLEVRGEQWKADIPFNEAFIARVDRAARTVEVQLPVGMLEPTRD